MRKVAFVVFALLLFASPVQATNYCSITGGRLAEGQTLTETMTIVVSSVPRVHVPGLPDNRTWCVQGWTSLGGGSSSKIIEGPKIGQVRTIGYRIGYRGDRVGHDRFVVEHRWLKPFQNDVWNVGRIVFAVDVLAQPF